ncbi:MAG TPA: toll/interleukin-1 receptor domain-containing protein [Planctomycetota bacterium]|nr:toll/interleukin-1 receptor domain-containing protein [Planctomycetota bacterium]
MAYKVFVSYSSSDLNLANFLKNLLVPHGIDVFVAEDSLLPGASLSAELKARINSCDLFLLLWSRNSRASSWVQQEVGAAVSADKPAIPIVLEPGLGLPGFLGDMKYLAAFRDYRQSFQWLEQEVIRRAENKNLKEAALITLGIVGAFVLLAGSGTE